MQVDAREQRMSERSRFFATGLLFLSTHTHTRLKCTASTLLGTFVIGMERYPTMIKRAQGSKTLSGLINESSEKARVRLQVDKCKSDF